MPTLLHPPPPVDEDITRRRFIRDAGALAMLLAACHVDGEGQATTVGPATRTMDTALGEVVVPVVSERPAVLNVIALDAVLRSGVTPVAYVGRPTPSLVDDLERVEYRAGYGELDVERLATLDPDLNLDGAFQGGLFVGLEPAVLEAIAPVVAFPFTSDLQWKDYNRFYAEAVGGREAVDGVLAEYDRRVAEVVEVIPSGVTVSVVRVRPDAVQSYSQNSFAAVILADLGISVVEVERELSLERLPEIDADAVYVFASEDDPAEMQQVLDDLTGLPLWNRLDAVQRGDAHVVGPSWFGFGPTEALVVLDDLERTLAN